MASSFCSSFPDDLLQLPCNETEEGFDFDFDFEFDADLLQLLLPFDPEHDQLQFTMGTFDHDLPVAPPPESDFILPPLSELNHQPKRQKTYDPIPDDYYFNNFNNPITWEPTFFPDHRWAHFDFIIPAAPPLPVPGLQPAAEEGKKQSLSAQSIAARQRRRRISDKTQELGKLIPGGNKMNTAEMFQSAADYVRFLQGQISILQLMESASIEPSGELGTLLGSHRIQQKLYSDGKCLAPTVLLRTIKGRPEVRSEPSVVQEIEELL